MNNDQILSHLSKVLDYHLFRKSKILSDFLSFIVRESLEGHNHLIKEYVIAVNVLKKATDFNPQLDAIVRIHAKRLRDSLDEYYQTEGCEEAIRIRIPKGRYIPFFDKQTGKSIAENKKNLERTAHANKPIIAVLPFTKFQTNEKLRVICSVLSHNLSLELTQFPELAVISNYSTEVASIKMTEKDDVVSHLGVDYFLTGTCVEKGEFLSISTELHKVKNKQIIWSKTFEVKNLEEQELTCITEVTKDVISLITGYFGIIYRDILTNKEPTSYGYLFAIYWHKRYHREFSETSFKEAISAIETGLEKNPSNATLHALKGELLLNLKVMDVGGDIDYIEEGTKWVKRAISMDPENQHAYQVLSWSHILRNKKDGFYECIDKMIAINPSNAMYLGAAGFAYVCKGDYDKGVVFLSESITLNPFYPWYYNAGYCLAYMAYGKYDEAYYWSTMLNRPNVLWDPLFKVACLGLLKEVEKAKEPMQQLLILSPNFSERARIIVRTFVLDLSLQEIIHTGLQAAGFAYE